LATHLPAVVSSDFASGAIDQGALIQRFIDVELAEVANQRPEDVWVVVCKLNLMNGDG